MAQIGWIDFCKEDRNRISKIMSLLREQGVLDELGIGVLRDGISDTLFPGLSTIQTRAKYFLYTPVIIRQYYKNSENKTLPEYFEEKESKYIQITSKQYKGTEENGIFGITLDDAGDLQRMPSAIYWNGQQILGVIDLKNKAPGFSQYLRANSIKVDHNYKRKADPSKKTEDEDDFDAANSDKTGIFLSGDIINNFDPSTINLTKSEASYLFHTFSNTLKSKHNDSLLYYLLTDKKLANIIINDKDLDFTGFYEKYFYENNGSIEMSGSITFRHTMETAYYFSNFVYGMHLLYNLLLQRKINNKDKENEYKNLWGIWITENENKIKGINLDVLFKLAPTAKKSTKNFVENFKKHLIEKNISKLEELIEEQEYNNKKGRARLKKQFLPPEECTNWIGMKTLNYRFYQAKVIVGDIIKADNNA